MPGESKLLQGPPLFREEQRFRQPWIWALVLPLCGGGVLFIAWGTYQQLVLGVPFGDKPMSDSGLIVFAAVFVPLLLGVLALIWGARLITEVHRDALYVRFVPFHRRVRRFAWDEIRSFEVRTYRPIREYGGWGLRIGPGGSAYNVSGNRGVQLHLVSGKLLLVGSLQPEELARAMHAASGT